MNGQRVDDNGATTDDERQIDTNDMRLYAPDDQDPATLLENRRSLDNSSFIEIRKKRQPMVAPPTQRAAVSARRSYDGNAEMPLSPPYSTDVSVCAHVRIHLSCTGSTRFWYSGRSVTSQSISSRPHGIERTHDKHYRSAANGTRMSSGAQRLLADSVEQEIAIHISATVND